MKIPIAFDLFGKSIAVKKTKKQYFEDNADGIGNLKSHVIKLQEPCEGYEANEREMEITFWHEVVHFIFYDLGFKLEDGTYIHRDEQFVDLMSLALHQVITTMRYEET